MNNQESIAIRKATPSYEDGLAFAKYADEITEGYLRFMFGPRVIPILAAAFMHPCHEYSYQHVLFAEQKNTIVGMASGYAAGQRHQFDQTPLKGIAGYNTLRVQFARVLSSPLVNILKKVPEDHFYLMFIGVDKEARGQGAGALLLDAVEKEASSAGSAWLSLDVGAKNEGAKRLYEKRGMAVISQWPKRFSPGGFRLLKMAKEL